MIDKNITIEELITMHPDIVGILSEKGIRCVVCGEPLWGTLEEAAIEKGWNEMQIDSLVSELRDLTDK